MSVQRLMHPYISLHNSYFFLAYFYTQIRVFLLSKGIDWRHNQTPQTPVLGEIEKKVAVATTSDTTTATTTDITSSITNDSTNDDNISDVQPLSPIISISIVLTPVLIEVNIYIKIKHYVKQ